MGGIFMKFLKRISCLLVTGAMLLPYTAIAEDSTGYGEAAVTDPFEPAQSGAISLYAEQASLTPTEIEMLKYIAGELPKLESSISLPDKYHMPVERFSYVYSNYMGAFLQYEHPEIFYLGDSFGYRYLNDSERTVTALNPVYKSEYAIEDGADKDAIKEAQDLIDAEVTNIVSGIDKLSPLEKILYVHDYIVANYEYDERVLDDDPDTDGNRSLDKMVIEKKGVCQGYTYLFMVAMERLGIECTTVPANDLAHIWNKVKLDGKWYNIDLTYDDPVSDRINSVSHDYFLVTDDEIKALDPSDIEYEYFYHIDGHGNIVVDENGDPVIYAEEKENSCHIRWNSTTWDGQPVLTSTSTDFSTSPIHSISGVTAYKDGKFFCVNKLNEICEVIFEETEEVLRERYVLSTDYRWFAYGQDRIFYTDPQPDDNNFPYYFSSVAGYKNKVYFNSPDTVYEFDTENYELKPVYVYDVKPDASKTYFYGLRVENDTLYAEYTEDVNESVELFAIPVPEEEAPTATPTPEPTEEPEIFPEFDEPLPCTVDTPQIEEKKTVDEETQEEKVSYEVTVSVTIPEEVEQKTEEVNKPVTVKVAKYSEAGVFLGFADVELTKGEDDKTSVSFTADDSCDTIKTFVWSGFIMPLAMAEAVGLTNTSLE